MYNSNVMIPIEELHEKIRSDLLSGSENKIQIAIKALLPAFNRFVKDTIKRGDYAQFKKAFEAENNKEITNEDYILNLSDIFLEPFLPLDLNDLDKHKPLLLKFSKTFIKTYM